MIHPRNFINTICRLFSHEESNRSTIIICLLRRCFSTDYKVYRCFVIRSYVSNVDEVHHSNWIHIDIQIERERERKCVYTCDAISCSRIRLAMTNNIHRELLHVLEHQMHSQFCSHIDMRSMKNEVKQVSMLYFFSKSMFDHVNVLNTSSCFEKLAKELSFGTANRISMRTFQHLDISMRWEYSLILFNIERCLNEQLFYLTRHYIVTIRNRCSIVA
jgi:hypothetical protein